MSLLGTKKQATLLNMGQRVLKLTTTLLRNFSVPWAKFFLRPSGIESHLRRIKAQIFPHELKEGENYNEHEWSEDDLLQISEGQHQSRLFMGYYSVKGFQTALERYGLFDWLHNRGFEHLLVSIDTADPDAQRLRIHFDQEDSKHLLVELIVRYRTLITPSEAVNEGAEEAYRLLSIDWLLMQNPRARFSREHLPLPGQRYPGLGLSQWVLQLLKLMAERLDCAGLMSIPQYYHNAFHYGRHMRCFHPEDQGYLEAMFRDLSHISLAEASLAIEQGRLRLADTNNVVQWEGKPQILPMSKNLKAYFKRTRYVTAVERSRKQYHFKLEK